jgi:hypothetical protein
MFCCRLFDRLEHSRTGREEKMTRLSKSVSRVVNLDGDDYVVTMKPGLPPAGPPTIEFRRKRGRFRLTLLLGMVFTRAAVVAAEDLRVQRKHRRREATILRAIGGAR